MTSVTIRQALPQEYEILLTLSSTIEISKTWQMEQVFEDGAWNIRFKEVSLPRPVHLAYPFSPKDIREHLVTNELNLLAEEKSQPVGFLSLEAKSGTQVARVTDLIIAGQNRRKGIATALMIAAVEWLVERNLNGITLEMMLKNHPGINLSRKMGFHLAGFNDVYYSNGQTAVYFYRKIA
jgi:ribosomal protein S18 acetylase RimI-like enzyme